MHKQHTLWLTVLAFLSATLLAWFLPLSFPLSAGLLAILSVQITRIDSIKVAFTRLISVLMAIGVASVFFVVLGYSLWVWLSFSTLFILASYAGKLQAGIVPSLVLVSYLLDHGSFSWSVALNSVYLMVLAVAVALSLSFLFPYKVHTRLKNLAENIDTFIRDDVKTLYDGLNDRVIDVTEWNKRKETFKQQLETAEEVNKDWLFSNDRMMMAYFRMRRQQKQTCDRMMHLITQLPSSHPYQTIIAEFMASLVSAIGQENQATAKKQALEMHLADFRQKPLPKTRQEFETRAILYQLIQELFTFLNFKERYHERYVREN